jgi:hypothetical protein
VREAEEAAARVARAEQIAREEEARLIREAEEAAAAAGLQGVVHDEEGDHEEEESSDEESDENEDPSHHEQGQDQGQNQGQDHVQNQEQEQEQEQDQGQGQEQEQNRPSPPVDVRPFRRGGVFGHELKTELQRIIAALVDDTLYSDQLLQLYNDATRV